MRRARAFYSCFVLSVGLAAAPLAFAAPPEEAATDNPAIVPGRSAAEWYGYATGHLKSGRWFERAAAQLKEAVRQEPDSLKYRLALGCAYASRAASIGFAAASFRRFKADQAKYREQLAAWEAAQKEPSSPAYRQPRPIPPSLRTRDDNRPFTLTPIAAVAQVAELNKLAVAEWDKALALAKTPEEGGEVHYIRSWGLRLLRSHLKTGDGKMLDVPGLPEEETAKAFVAATEAAPDNARYWQSLGDARMGEGFFTSMGKDQPGAIAAYVRSLALEARNPTLWCRLYELYQLNAPRDSQKAKEAIAQAAATDPGNAYALYRLAALQFRQTRYRQIEKHATTASASDESLRSLIATANTEENQKAAREALATLDHGNTRLRYAPLFYRPAVPDLLLAAWNYWVRNDDLDFADPKPLHEVYLSACGYALVCARQNNQREAVHAARAAIGMGYKMIGDFLDKRLPSDPKDSIICLLASGAARKGYNTLEQVYRQFGNVPMAEQVAAEHDAFRKRIGAQLQAGRQMRANSYGDY